MEKLISFCRFQMEFHELGPKTRFPQSRLELNQIRHSQNLIKKGLVIDKLLDSLIITEGIKCDDLVLGDKNAVMVAARVLAYGPEYEWWEYVNATIDMYYFSPFGPISCYGDLNSKSGCKCYTYNNNFESENFISTNSNKPIYVQIDEFKSKNKKFILESTIRKKCTR